MHNPESVLKNEMQKLLWNFEIQMDCLSRPDDQTLKLSTKKKKKICKIVDFAVPADHRVKLKRKISTYTLLGIEKNVERESDGYTNCNCTLGIVTKGFIKGLENLEIRGQKGKPSELQHC